MQDLPVPECCLPKYLPCNLEYRNGMSSLKGCWPFFKIVVARLCLCCQLLQLISNFSEQLFKNTLLFSYLMKVIWQDLMNKSKKIMYVLIITKAITAALRCLWESVGGGRRNDPHFSFFFWRQNRSELQKNLKLLVRWEGQMCYWFFILHLTFFSSSNFAIQLFKITVFYSE